MRVIAGSAKGRRLKSPPAATRPTSDLLRGAIFDMLDALGADYSRVLDLYAGSGALGIEALSRGGGRCDFVDNDRVACAVIRDNIRAAGFEEQAAVHTINAARVLDSLSGPYTLIIADPPYADEENVPTLREIALSSLVDADTILVLEHSSATGPAAEIGSLSLIKTRKHGGSAFSVYARR
jgi:16S rRNA (guanine966-N2)-methyltransferase